MSKYTPQPGYTTPKKKSQLNGKCVCQICTCGKDRCPPQPNHVDPTHFDTTNKKAYQKWDIPKQQQIIKSPTKIHYGTQSFVSSYNRDYTPQKIMQRDPQIISGEHISTPNLKLQGQSEYKESYQKQSTINTPLKTTSQWIPSNDKTYQNLMTTYKQEYKQKPLSKSQLIKPPENILTHNLQQYAKSSYQDDYIPITPKKTQQYKPIDTSVVGGVMVEKQSKYQNDYPIYNLDSYKKPECPVRTLPSPYNRTTPSPNKHLIFNSDKNNWE